MKKIITFVILHYETLDDTAECINSIKKYMNDNINVVIVDNGSVNGRLINIEKKYSNYNNIHFIYSNENLGFAKGNNLGFHYAKYKLKSDIIILCNNDLVFKQKDFLNILLKKLKQLKFDVAGPKIISTVDGYNQNPTQRMYNNIKDVKRRITKFSILRLLCIFNLDKMFQNIYSSNYNNYDYLNNDDYQLHGACLIFANNYLKMFDGLYDGTFMYGEESILKFIVEKNKLNMIYLDELEVFHKESSSTQKIWGKGKKNRYFFYKWNIKSCKKLIRLMKD